MNSLGQVFINLNKSFIVKQNLMIIITVLRINLFLIIVYKKIQKVPQFFSLSTDPFFKALNIT